MKMEVLAVQQQYQTQFSGLGSNKYRDWTSTLTPPLSAIVNMNTTTVTTATSSNKNTTAANNISSNTSTPYHLHHHYHYSNLNHHHHRQSATTTNNKMKNSINNKKSNRQNAAIETKSPTTTTTTKLINSSNILVAQQQRSNNSNNNNNNNTNTNNNNNNVNNATTTANSNNFYYCDNNDIDAAAINELSLRLLDELRAAKSRHLTCTEVSLPCNLTPSIAAEIIRVSEKEPCGIRGCTIYIEFEDEPNNSRRIASLKLDSETVSTFEVYLTLRQDHRGWTSLLPQFMKSFARTITISPEFTITKHKLYSPQQRLSYTATTTTTGTAAISTPSS